MNNSSESNEEIEVISTCSEASSLCEEEKIRKLFQVCDRNGDGFIDSSDLLYICQELNMEDLLDDILVELGADERGMVSFEEFLQKRLALKSNIGKFKNSEQKAKITDQNLSSSGTSLGTSVNKEMWEFDSGARDLSPIPSSLQRLVEAAGGSINSANSAGILELANKLHMAAVDSLKTEISDLVSQLRKSRLECHSLRKDIERYQVESSFEVLKEQYEEQITELHSVIAELTKKAENQTNIIIEEESVSDAEVNQQINQHQGNRNSPSVSLEDEIRSEVTEDITEITDTSNDNNWDDKELWKRKYQREKSENHVLQIILHQVKEQLQKFALLFAENESSVLSYDTALQAAKKVLTTYAELDAFHQSLIPKTIKRTKTERLMRENLVEQINELETLLKNIIPLKFFSESQYLESHPVERGTSLDLETAILIQEIMQEREQKAEMQQKLQTLQSECDYLKQKMQLIDSLPTCCSQCICYKEGLCNNMMVLKNKDKLNEKWESSSKNVLVKQHVTKTYESNENSSKLKILENKFHILVDQHSEQVKTLKTRIYFLENLLKEK